MKIPLSLPDIGKSEKKIALEILKFTLVNTREI